jgi:dolichol kinase
MFKSDNRYDDIMKSCDSRHNSHWFRRMIHVSGACALVYYLYPDSVLWIYILKIIIMLILISAIIVEGLRLSNRLDEGFLFPFRTYEANRVGAYIWFSISISSLLLFFPQQIAGPCVLTLCLADPLIGEIRNKNHILSVITGIAACFCIFLIFNYQAHIALFAALVGVGAEGIKSKKVDDDFLMPMAPAIVIYILTLLGIISLPEILITPFPM